MCILLKKKLIKRIDVDNKNRPLYGRCIEISFRDGPLCLLNSHVKKGMKWPLINLCVTIKTIKVKKVDILPLLLRIDDLFNTGLLYHVLYYRTCHGLCVPKEIFVIKVRIIPLIWVRPFEPSFTWFIHIWTQELSCLYLTMYGTLFFQNLFNGLFRFGWKE